MKLVYSNTDERGVRYARLTQRLFGRTCAAYLAITREMYNDPTGRSVVAAILLEERREVRAKIARAMRGWQRAQRRK